MRLITVTGLAAALVLTATPAFAVNGTAKDPAAFQEKSVSAEAGDKKVCRRIESTGTRMKSERVCLTKAEWRKVEAMK